MSACTEPVSARHSSYTAQSLTLPPDIGEVSRERGKHSVAFVVGVAFIQTSAGPCPSSKRDYCAVYPSSERGLVYISPMLFPIPVLASPLRELHLHLRCISASFFWCCTSVHSTFFGRWTSVLVELLFHWYNVDICSPITRT